MKRKKMEQMRILVTSACNLFCSHCYQQEEKNKYVLSTEQIKELISFAVDYGVKDLVLSGGEFFCHPSAYDIISYCMEKNQSITIVTNGTNMDTDFFEKYRNMGKITFQISVDGLKENHEKRRGEGTFDKTMNHIRILHGMGYPVNASTAVDEFNFTDMAALLKRKEFKKIQFLPVAYAGAAKKKEKKELESFYYEKTMLYLYQNRIAIETDSHLYPEALGIKYDGTVYLSPVAQDMGVFCIGNIKEKKIDEILEEYEKEDPFGLIREKNSVFQDCKGCEKEEFCKIRSLERAYKAFGSIKGPDPFGCRVYKDAFSGLPLGKVFWGEIEEEKHV